MGYRGCTVCGKTMSDDGSPCPHCGGVGGTSQWFCTACGDVVAPAKLSGFSFVIFIVLCLIMVLPGVLYLAYFMVKGSTFGCPRCRRQTLIPADSPVARAALARGSQP